MERVGAFANQVVKELGELVSTFRAKEKKTFLKTVSTTTETIHTPNKTYASNIASVNPNS